MDAGHVVKLPAASTIADGTAVLEPGDLVYPYVRDNVVSTIRDAAVELRVTVEAFGEDHKMQIVDALEAGGFDPSIVQTSL